jgi:putative nucleotidyltransferase with HDIG domain
MDKLEKIIRICKFLYPPHNYEGHIKPVADIAMELCEAHGADPSVVEPAAYLHDIGRILFPYLEAAGISHAVTGYASSKPILRLCGYSEEETEKIGRAVLTHRSSRAYPPSNLEEEIISNADAMAHFEQYLYLLSIRYSTRAHKNLSESKGWVLNKLAKSYTKLTLPGAKDRIEEIYTRAKHELLNDVVQNKISFVVIGYNEGRHLEGCLKSIQAQTYAPSEIIYVDSTSSDNSLEIAGNYATKTMVVPKKGANPARNAGGEAATGDIIIFIDGNDSVPLDMAYKVNEAVNNGAALGTFRWSVPQFSLKDNSAQLLLNLSASKAWPACFVEKDLFERSGGFDGTSRCKNDLLSLAENVRAIDDSVKPRRIKATIYSNMEEFHKTGYIPCLYDWLR